MSNRNSLKISELVKQLLTHSDPGSGYNVAEVLKLQGLPSKAITQRLLVDYTEPFIYYGCSNRGNRGKTRMNIKRDWYIGYDYKNPHTGKMELQMVKGPEGMGINKYKTIRERLPAARNLLAAVKEILLAGYSPYREEIPTEVLNSADMLGQMPVSKAILWGLEVKNTRGPKRKGIALSTYQDYRSMLKYWNVAFEKEGIAQVPISDLSRRQIKKAWNKIPEIRKEESGKLMGSARHNDYLFVLSTICDELVEEEMIEKNPCELIKLNVTIEANHFESLTDEERLMVSSYYKQKNFRFYVLLKTIYRCYVRGKELVRLQIQDVKLDERILLLTPENAQIDEKTKTKKKRRVPLDDDLLNDWKSLDLDIWPADYFVFSEVGTFMPGQKPMWRNRLSEEWRREVIEGMGINKKMYGLKRTGADARMKMPETTIPENLTVEQMFRMMLEMINQTSTQRKIERLQILMGHESAEMTRIYISNEWEIAADMIRKNIPYF